MKEEKRDINIMLLRTVSMLMVTGVHYNLVFDLPSALSSVLAYGAKFVGVFLMFSSYLNMLSYKRSSSFMAFYKKKLLNIIPLYYMVLAANLLLRCGIYHDIKFELSRVIVYMLGLHMIIPSSDFYAWNNMGALWTISVFLFFYVITPLLSKKVDSMKKALAIFPIVYVGTMVIRKGMQIVLMRMHWVSDPIQFSNWFPLHLVVVYWVGIILYHAKQQKKHKLTVLYLSIVCVVLFVLKKTDFVFCGALAAAIYLMMDMYVTEYPKLIRSVISKVDEYTFEVYLIHPLVLYVYEKSVHGADYPMVSLFTSVFAIVLLSMIMKKFETMIKSLVIRGFSKAK